MKRLKIILVIGFLGVFLNVATKCKNNSPRYQGNSSEVETSASVVSHNFKCEGKKRCHEMYSCDEAMFYLNNCPNVEIDGDADGIPCEDQLCGH